MLERQRPLDKLGPNGLGVSGRKLSRFADSRGFSFIEISMAIIIFALALLPAFGLIQSGLIRSDVSASYSAATELASATMNRLLSDALPFQDIPISPAGQYLAPEGSVAHEGSLDLLFDGSGWATEERSRSRTKDNIKYFVEIWVGEFADDTDLLFRYLENPNIDYNRATPYNKYYGQMTLKDDDFDFSPYNAATVNLDTNQPGSAWATAVTTRSQWEVSSAQDPSLPHDQNQSLKKLVVRVSWSGTPTGRRALGGATKEILLVSFRANLGTN